MSRRKKKHEEHENHERWLVSYADFITLLFAFFVVMYSVSALNEGKFRVLSEALEAAFRSTPKSMSPVQFGHATKPEMLENSTLNRSAQAAQSDKPIHLMPQPGARPGMTEEERGVIAQEVLKEIADRVEQSLASLIKEDLVSVRRFQFWVEVEIKTNILFPSGSAELEPAAVPVLRRVAEIMRTHGNRIHIEGFTDNVPIHNSIYPSNWELSAARSASVVHLFVREGIAPERMAVVGYGEFKPVAPNEDNTGRQRNRKVVLVVLSEHAPAHARDLVQEPQQIPAKPAEKVHTPTVEQAAPVAVPAPKVHTPTVERAVPDRVPQPKEHTPTVVRAVPVAAPAPKVVSPVAPIDKTLTRPNAAFAPPVAAPVVPPISIGPS